MDSFLCCFLLYEKRGRRRGGGKKGRKMGGTKEGREKGRKKIHVALLESQFLVSKKYCHSQRLVRCPHLSIK